MKKTTSKIVLAVISLIIALGLATGTTFAWFSMNSTVSVTGMSVTARSDAINLVISNASSGTYGASALASSASKTVYPVKGTLSGTTVTWQTGTSTSPDDAMAGVAYQSIDETLVIADTDGYALLNKFYVKNTSVQNATNLRLKTFEVTEGTSAFSSALRVLVVGTSGGEIASVGNVAGTVLATSVTTTPLEIKVYLYYDGDDSSVITNYTGTLGALSVSLSFEVDDPAA